LEYLVKEAYTKVKQDKRKTVYYRDLGKNIKRKI
jgi:histone H3/H4